MTKRLTRRQARARERDEPDLDEKNNDFLEAYDINQYDRPSIAADIAVFSIGRKQAGGADYRRLPAKTLRILLIRRAEQPFQGEWALPGGFMQKGRR